MIERFHRYHDGLASGAQPSVDDLSELKNTGWEVVVNLSPASTKNALADEARVVEGLGLDYVHLPVDCSFLRPYHYQSFRGVLKSLEGRRVFVHCGGNIKSSNLIHLYRVLEEGVEPLASLAELQTIQSPEPKWFTYFDAMGIPQGANQR